MADGVDTGLAILNFDVAKRIKDVINLTELVRRAFTTSSMWNVDDSLLVWVQHLTDRIQVAPLVEVIANAQGFQRAVAVELLVVGVGHLVEARLIVWKQDRIGVATEVATGHGNDVS